MVLAVLDSNVLYSSQVRNLFLWCAVQDLYTPLWSQEIIDEVGRNIVRNGAMSAHQWSRLLGELRSHFGGAWGTGYESVAAGEARCKTPLSRPKTRRDLTLPPSTRLAPAHQYPV